MLLSYLSFMSMCMRGVVIIQGIVGLTRMWFTLGTLVDHMSRLLVSLGPPNMSLEFVVVGLQPVEFLLMVAFHLCDAGFELAESIIVHHGCWKRIGVFRGWFSPETKSYVDHKCVWLQEKFYHGPKLSTKCIYRNLEWTDIKDGSSFE